MFVPEKGWNSGYIHVLLAGLKPWQKVGGEPRPGPGSGQTATEMTHHGLNQSLIFLQWHGQCFVHMLEISANAQS